MLNRKFVLVTVLHNPALVTGKASSDLLAADRVMPTEHVLQWRSSQGSQADANICSCLYAPHSTAALVTGCLSHRAASAGLVAGPCHEDALQSALELQTDE